MSTWYTVTEIEAPIITKPIPSTTLPLEITNGGRVCGGLGPGGTGNAFKYLAGILEFMSLGNSGWAAGINEQGDIGGVFFDPLATDYFSSARCFFWPQGAPALTNVQSLIPEANDSWG